MDIPHLQLSTISQEVKAKDAMKIDGEEEYIDDDAATTSSKETSASPEGGSYIDEVRTKSNGKAAKEIHRLQHLNSNQLIQPFLLTRRDSQRRR